VATDEERAIAQATARMASSADVVEQKMLIPIAISARHIHLTRSAIDTLFGPGHQLTPIYDLSQPGQYACAEQLTLVGPRHSIPGVRILGPERPDSQVEISRTDEFVLGVDAPVRDSGDVRNSPGITLQGPKGSLTLREGLICARRHIHMHPDDARRFGVKDRDVVEIAIDSEGRDLIFGDVLVRVSDKFRLEMHVDTDEANAAQLQKGATGMLEASGHDARLLRRKTAYDDV
jgi:acetate kinase